MFGAGMTSARTRARLIEKLGKMNLACTEVLDVMNDVPRHVFVDEALAHRAYEDTILPIGFRQTISQPRVVAMMSGAIAGVSDRSRVLEIGTGCGYQTAILARLFDEVFTVERIQPLLTRAQRTLAELEVHNVSYKLVDGHIGWHEYGPYNAVIGTASAEIIPEELFVQVALNGRLVLPVDDAGFNGQSLLQLDRFESGFVRKKLSSVRFVPMLKGIEWSA